MGYFLLGVILLCQKEITFMLRIPLWSLEEKKKVQKKAQTVSSSRDFDCVNGWDQG